MLITASYGLTPLHAQIRSTHISWHEPSYIFFIIYLCIASVSTTGYIYNLMNENVHDYSVFVFSDIHHHLRNKVV